MVFSFVDAFENKQLFQFGTEGTTVSPEAGDTFVAPDGQQYEVVKRAFVCQKRSMSEQGVIEVSRMQGAFTIDIELRCAVVKVEELPKYLEQVRRGQNARS